MTRVDQELNDKCAKKPSAGDYWHEMLMPVCIVLDADDYFVTFVKFKYFDDVYIVDESSIETVTIGKFRKWLSYSSAKGYWADVVHGKYHEWAKRMMANRLPSHNQSRPLWG